MNFGEAFDAIKKAALENAKDPANATQPKGMRLPLWKEDVVTGGYIPNLNPEAFSKSFDEDFDEFPPLPLNELRNVWIFHLLLDDEQMDVHIIKTDTVLVEKLAGIL